jgi:DNA polymerase-4
MKDRTIIHIDMDAFFASVEQKVDPSLRGKPVMVCGGLNTRTVVAAASYEAREYGVHAGMSLAVARVKCPGGIFIEGDPQKYIYTSIRLNDVYREFTHLVEEFSIDESFLDVADVADRYGGVVELARQLKARVFERFGLTCSVGIGPNKILAKTASKLEKPDGLTVLAREDIPTRFQSLPVGKLYGVGEETAKKLEILGVRTIGQLARIPVPALKKVFGVIGELLHDAAAGIDESPVLTAEEQPPAKSIGNEYTFQSDTRDDEVIHSVLLGLCSKVARRLRKGGHAGRTVTLKVRFADFNTISRGRTLEDYMDLDKEIFDVAREVLAKVQRQKAIRLLGVSVSNLTHTPPEKQRSLFDYSFWKKYKKVIESVDKARDKYGERAIVWAALIKREREAG